MYPPEFQERTEYKSQTDVCLRRAQDFVDMEMAALYGRIESLVVDLRTHNRLDRNAVCPFVQSLEEELEALYMLLFGTEFWKTTHLESSNSTRPYTFGVLNTLCGVIGDGVYNAVCPRRLPWDIEPDIAGAARYGME